MPPRFIPARAGNTCRRSRRDAGAAVHPRAGGEHLTRLHGLFLHCGSSPRGRGTRLRPHPPARGHRFIPARAGNTGGMSSGTGGITVHPRAGGEHRPSFGIGRQPFGSSPRGRGTRPRARARHGGQRFIPARAGNTSPASGPARCPSVHPRAGGEHLCAEHRPACLVGSSPRGRGTRGADALRPPREPVHPRAGGEHSWQQVLTSRLLGSSPRGRGTLGRGIGREDGDRFIPARAGNTRCRLARRCC